MRVNWAWVWVGSAVLVSAPMGCPQPVGPSSDPDDDQAPALCVDDEECATGFCRFGVCVDGECVVKGDCAVDQICRAGACVAPPASCTGPDDCPGASLCDGFTDTCFDPSEGEGEGAGEGEGEGEGEGGGPALDLGGFRLENRETSTPAVTRLPDGLLLSPGDVLVIGRNASESAFVSFWGPLPPSARYLDAGIESSGVPVINGGEVFALVNDAGATIDGPTRAGRRESCYRRTAAVPGADGSWAEVPVSEATPGTSTAVPGLAGVVISEWCDAVGQGNFIYEYVELTSLGAP
jgi:hypothetical protein